MKITAVSANNRKKCFEVLTSHGSYVFPFAKLETSPTSNNPIMSLYVDEELGSDGFTYALKDGRETSVLMDQILDYHQDPKYMTDLALYNLTVEARKRIEQTRMSIRSLSKLMGTSPSQLYRLLDTTNYSKSMNNLLILLHFLGCDVDLTVRDRKSNAG